MELSEHTPAAPLSVDALLEQAVALGASDLHLTSGVQPAFAVAVISSCSRSSPSSNRISCAS